MNTDNISSINFSTYDSVLCDSLQALEWAYNNGLPKSTTIRSSAPALLWNKDLNVKNIENKWTPEKVKEFQHPLQDYTQKIFDAVSSVNGVERELALTITKSFYKFQKILYKASCLQEEDFSNSVLQIYVKGKTGPAGNIMNYPWEQLLLSNKSFNKVCYTLANDDWKVLTTQGVSHWRRFMVAGYETIIFRLLAKTMSFIPDRVFSKEIIMPNENELNIEIAYALALRGVKVSKPKFEHMPDTINIAPHVDFNEVYESILPLINKRVKHWVVSSAVTPTISLFKLDLEKQINEFKLLSNKWKNVLANSNIKKQALLVNSPGNYKGNALSYVCRKRKIPLISSQHGVTVEISKMHDMLYHGLDNTVADIMFSYNSKIKQVEENTYFNNSKHYVVGMPLRLIRMKLAKTAKKVDYPIVYISTNIYHKGFSLSPRSSYHNAIVECKIVMDILGKLPHKVCYKTYPEDNRRHADEDPVLECIKKFNNINLFSDKVDMRYLISKHKIFITTCATSTLGWPIMSEKPVIFINQEENNPLTEGAYHSLSKGIFVFNYNDKGFYQDIFEFLSQPIGVIEKLWQDKKIERKVMVEDYFSAFSEGGAGKRASKIILDNYL